MTKTYTVKARRWDGGWELHIEDLGVTQVADLADAEEMVLDYVGLLGLEAGEIRTHRDGRQQGSGIIGS